MSEYVEARRGPYYSRRARSRITRDAPGSTSEYETKGADWDYPYEGMLEELRQGPEADKLHIPRRANGVLSV